MGVKMLKKLIYLSFIVGLTACGGGKSDIEACVKNSAINMIDQTIVSVEKMSGFITPEEAEETRKEGEETKKNIMSSSWEEMQKWEMGEKWIGMCENMKAEEPDKFKKAVKGDFSNF